MNQKDGFFSTNRLAFQIRWNFVCVLLNEFIADKHFKKLKPDMLEMGPNDSLN